MSFNQRLQNDQESEQMSTFDKNQPFVAVQKKSKRKKLIVDDDDGNISISQNSKLPSIIPDRKSGLSMTNHNFLMNYQGGSLVDIEELASPPGSSLKFNEFELVPKIRETYNTSFGYGMKPNPDLTSIYNKQFQNY